MLTMTLQFEYSFGQELEKGYYHLAEIEFDLENYRQSLVFLDSASALSPSDYKIYLLEAEIYLAREDIRRAITSYDKVINYNPNYDLAYVERARLRYEVRDHRDYSLSDINSAISLKPNYPPYYILYAYYLAKTDNALTGKPDYILAIDNMDIAISLDPENAGYYDLRGKSKFDLDQPLGAIADFSKAIALEPTNPVFYHDRGLTKLIIEDYDGAVEDFTAAVRYDPMNEMYLLKRGHAKFNMGKYEDAIEDFTLALNTTYNKISDIQGRILPSHPLNKSLQQAYIFRGSALMQTEYKYEACVDFKTARGLGDPKAANYVSQYCH